MKQTKVLLPFDGMLSLCPALFSQFGTSDVCKRILLRIYHSEKLKTLIETAELEFKITCNKL